MLEEVDADPAAARGLDHLPARVFDVVHEGADAPLQRADGPTILQGVALGVGAALFAGVLDSLFCTSVGGEDCGVPDPALKAAPFTISAGLVWGLFSTDWDRVYEAHPAARPPVILPEEMAGPQRASGFALPVPR